MTAFKFTRAEKAAILITVIFAAFMLGVFFGRTTVKPAEITSAAEASVYVYHEEAEVSESASDSAQTAAVTDETEPSAAEAVPSAAKSSPEPSAQESSAIWTADSGVQLDLNQASLEELENLPSIGPVLAQAILDYRQANGNYQSVEELLNVDGIGDKTLEKIRQYVTAEN